MDFNNLCMGCMNDKGNSEVCPYCGFIPGTPPDSPLCLVPNTILNGQYLIGRVLGHGGFGITYLAWDMNLDIKVAIKEYMPEGLVTRLPSNNTVSVYSGDKRASFEYGVERFLEEAKVLAKFKDNPCIVSVNNFFKENGTAYFVMDYVEGVSLKQHLANKGGKLSYEETLLIIMPVLDSLRAVHGMGLLHRDISPDNIFITSKGMIKLLDFGAARYSVGEHSKSLSIILKPGFAPEEQYRSKGKQGPWTDVYAVSATMYRMITGLIPVECMDRMAEDELKPPSYYGVDIKKEHEAALMKAMAIKAVDRFQTVDEFQNALLQGIAVKGIQPVEKMAMSKIMMEAPPENKKPFPSDTGKKNSILKDNRMSNKEKPISPGIKGEKYQKRKFYTLVAVIACITILALTGVLYKAWTSGKPAETINPGNTPSSSRNYADETAKGHPTPRADVVVKITPTPAVTDPGTDVLPDNTPIVIQTPPSDNIVTATEIPKETTLSIPKPTPTSSPARTKATPTPTPKQKPTPKPSATANNTKIVKKNETPVKSQVSPKPKKTGTKTKTTKDKEQVINIKATDKGSQDINVKGTDNGSQDINVNAPSSGSQDINVKNGN